MMRRLLVLTFLLIGTTLGMRTAYACSCVAPPGLAEAVQQAEVAFYGEVVKKWGDGGLYDIRVDGVIKGRVEPVVTVRTGGHGSCNTELELGPILYAYTADLSLHSCAPRWTDSIPARLAAVNLTAQPVAHAPPEGLTEDQRVAWALPLAAGVAVAAGGLLLVLRRRQNDAASAGGTTSAG